MPIDFHELGPLDALLALESQSFSSPVEIENLQDGDTVVWSDATGEWVNRQPGIPSIVDGGTF